MPLDTRAARQDLTDRECSKLIGGLIGSLHLMARDGTKTVRAAVRWWADNDQAWKAMEDLETELVRRGMAKARCKHEHLSMEGICHACGSDCRGF